MMIPFSLNHTEISLISAYIAGLATCLTPCVYPLIPITLALFGVQKNDRKSTVLLKALTYIAGLTITFTAFGIISATTGSLFGRSLNSPYVIVPIIALLIYLALHLMGLTEFKLLNHIQNFAGRFSNKTGYVGNFILGSLSGFIAAPCVGPILVVILGLAAKSESGLYGGLLLFVYSMGLGTVFLMLALFSGLISKMPKSGNWLNGVKYFFAVVLLYVATYLASTTKLLPINSLTSIHPILIFCTCLVILVYLIKINARALRFPLLLLLTICLFVSTFSQTDQQTTSNTTNHLLTWNDESYLVDTQTFPKPVMIDFYADWCIACTEYDKITFRNQEVIHTLTDFVLIKIDLTTDDEKYDALKEKFNIVGLPAILFLSPDGTEIEGARIAGYLTPVEFIGHIQTKVLTTST